MKILFFIFILALSFTSCNSNDDNNSKDETQIEFSELIGQWNWVSTCGGITGECGYPSDELFYTIEFNDDLSYIKITNGTQTETSSYIITDVLVIDSLNYYLIEFEEGNPAYCRIDEDILFITTGEIGSYYERIIEEEK